jgi:glycolate oxidase
MAGHGDQKEKDHKTRPLKDYWGDTMVCTYCGFCKSVCPTFRLTKDETRAPRSKVIISYGILSGEIEPDETIRDALYTCTTCMDCTRRCPSKVKSYEIVMAARRLLASKGLIPTAERIATDNIAKAQNPMGEPKEKRTEFVPEAAMARVGKGAEVLVYVGCVTSFSDMKMVKNLFDIMEKAKVDYTYLGQDEPCCGMMNYLVGLTVEPFAKGMKGRLDGLKPRPSTVVTPCPGCFRSLTQNYAEHVDLGVEVKHSLQFILDLIEKGKLKVSKKLEGKVFYHDPCDLGRHTGIYDEPRKLLSFFAEVNEFPHKRDQAHCCGGGGGLQAVNFEMAGAIAKERLKEAVAKGADIVVSACPGCKANFSQVLSELKKETGKPLKVMDLTDIVAKYTTGAD